MWFLLEKLFRLNNWIAKEASRLTIGALEFEWWTVFKDDNLWQNGRRTLNFCNRKLQMNRVLDKFDKFDNQHLNSKADTA